MSGELLMKKSTSTILMKTLFLKESNGVSTLVTEKI